MRSRQTGQVGSSMREGVGGALGLLDRVVDDEDMLVACNEVDKEVGWEALITDGVKGSFVMSGKEDS